MRDIAIRDHHEYLVDSVLEHTGNPKRKSEMSFKVRWTGYSEEHDSWEPWKNIRLVDKLHEYLRDNDMAKLIPTTDSFQAEPTPPVPIREDTPPPVPIREDPEPPAKRQRRRRAQRATPK